MTKKNKLKLCDWSLLVLTVFVLVSGLYLELTNSQDLFWVWVHVVLCSVFIGAVVWHLYLHFKWKSWFRRLKGQKSPVTRLLALFGVLAFVSGIVATAHWVCSYTHASIGGVHGKLGFIFIALAAGHTAKRIKRLFKNI